MTRLDPIKREAMTSTFASLSNRINNCGTWEEAILVMSDIVQWTKKFMDEYKIILVNNAKHNMGAK